MNNNGIVYASTAGSAEVKIQLLGKHSEILTVSNLSAEIAVLKQCLFQTNKTVSEEES